MTLDNFFASGNPLHFHLESKYFFFKTRKGRCRGEQKVLKEIQQGQEKLFFNAYTWQIYVAPYSLQGRGEKKRFQHPPELYRNALNFFRWLTFN